MISIVQLYKLIKFSLNLKGHEIDKLTIRFKIKNFFLKKMSFYI